MSHEFCRDAHAELQHQLKQAEETTEHYAAECERLKAERQFGHKECDEEISRLRVQVTRVGEALGNGADDKRWPPGVLAVDAMIAENETLRATLAEREAQLEKSEEREKQGVALFDGLVAELRAALREREAELTALMDAVGYVNRAEGQGGCERLTGEDLARRWREREAEIERLKGELALEKATGKLRLQDNKDCQRELDEARAALAKAQEELGRERERSAHFQGEADAAIDAAAKARSEALEQAAKEAEKMVISFKAIDVTSNNPERLEIAARIRALASDTGEET